MSWGSRCQLSRACDEARQAHGSAYFCKNYSLTLKMFNGISLLFHVSCQPCQVPSGSWFPILFLSLLFLDKHKEIAQLLLFFTKSPQTAGPQTTISNSVHWGKCVSTLTTVSAAEWRWKSFPGKGYSYPAWSAGKGKARTKTTFSSICANWHLQ